MVVTVVIWSKRRKEGTRRLPPASLPALEHKEHEDGGMFQKRQIRDSQGLLKPGGRKDRKDAKESV